MMMDVTAKEYMTKRANLIYTNMIERCIKPRSGALNVVKLTKFYNFPELLHPLAVYSTSGHICFLPATEICRAGLSEQRNGVEGVGASVRSD